MRFRVLKSAGGRTIYFGRHGVSFWRPAALSLLSRGDVGLQFVFGNHWTPRPDYRRAKDWSLSLGPLHIVRGDWWAAPGQPR